MFAQPAYPSTPCQVLFLALASSCIFCSVSSGCLETLILTPNVWLYSSESFCTAGLTSMIQPGNDISRTRSLPPALAGAAAGAVVPPAGLVSAAGLASAAGFAAVLGAWV